MKEVLEKTAALKAAIGGAKKNELTWLTHTLERLEQAAPGVQRKDFANPGEREAASKAFADARTRVLDAIKDTERVCD
jgi:hypothetical protein